MIAETERWPCDPERLPLTIDDLESAAKAIRQQPPSAAYLTVSEIFPLEVRAKAASPLST
jgi:hypothetical protein